MKFRIAASGRTICSCASWTAPRTRPWLLARPEGGVSEGTLVDGRLVQRNIHRVFGGHQVVLAEHLDEGLDLGLRRSPAPLSGMEVDEGSVDFSLQFHCASTLLLAKVGSSPLLQRPLLVCVLLINSYFFVANLFRTLERLLDDFFVFLFWQTR